MHWFLSLTLGRKLALAFSLVLAALLALSLKNWLTLDAIQHDFDLFSSAASSVEQARQYETRVLEFVAGAEAFLVETSEKKKKDLEASGETLISDIAVWSETLPPSLQADAEAAEAQVETLLKDFRQFGSERLELLEFLEVTLLGRIKDIHTSLAESSDTATRSGALWAFKAELYHFEAAVWRYLELTSEESVEEARQVLVTLKNLIQFERSDAVDQAAVDAMTKDFEFFLTSAETEAKHEKEFFGTDVAQVVASIQTLVDHAVELEHAAEEDIIAQKESAKVWAVVALVVVAILLFAISYVMQITVSTPLRTMTAIMKRLADGALDVDVPKPDRTDEVGDMNEALVQFNENNQERERLRREQRKAAEQRRFRQDEIDQMIGMFGRSTDAVLREVEGVSQDLAVKASAMRDAVRSNVSDAQEVSGSAQAVTQNMTTVSSATQELTSAILEIGKQIEDAGQMARDSLGEAEQAGNDVAKLRDQVENIGAVTQLIRDISEQTNLLALNATIEAARAGEAGKGFTVVANEVKALAAQTNNATGEIDNAMGAVRESTQTVVAVIKRIELALERLNDVAQAVAAATTEQEAATSEIARSVDMVQQESMAVQERITGIESSAIETQTGAEQSSEQATDLAGDAKTLADEVRNFLDGVSDGETRETIERMSVELDAEIEVGQIQRKGRTVKVSPASVELQVDSSGMQPGQIVMISLPGSGRMKGRCAKVEGSGIIIQLPMDRDSLINMTTYLSRLQTTG